MNLKEIREAVERELVFDPNIEAHREDVNKLINAQYMQIMDSQAWPFRHKIAEVRLMKDREIAKTALTNVTGGRSLTAPDSNFTTGHTSDVNVDELAGHVIDFGSTVDEDSNNNQASGYDIGGASLDRNRTSYVIERAYKSAGNTVTIHPDPRYNYADFGSGNATVKALKYRLPNDCAEVLGVMSRDDDRGLIHQIDLPAERQYMLNPDETGDPTVWMTDPLLVSRSTGFDDYGREFFERHSNRPMSLLSSSESSTGGYLPDKTRFQYFVVWQYAGRVSPPSPITEATTQGNGSTHTNKIVLYFHNDDVMDSQYLGRQRLVFRRMAESEGNTPVPYSDKNWGPWLLAAVIDDPSVTNYNDTSASSKANWMHASLERRWEDYEPPGQYQYVRFWPRPDTDKTVEVRYLARAKKLYGETATPELPLEYHPLIVHKVVQMLAIRHEAPDLSKVHGKLALELERRMRRRYLNSKGQVRRRKSHFSQKHHAVEIPTVDYVNT
tara:strand:+ start:116 stop:1606 length:1491 start_codon:yes stop_codon:yes gene_type:complete